MPDPSSISKKPLSTAEPQVNQLNMQDSPVEDLFHFIRRQPVKHLLTLLAGGFAVLSFVAGTSWAIAVSNAEHKTSLRVSELNSQITRLKTEVATANKIEGYLREDLKTKAAELQSTKKITQSLQEAISDKNRKLLAAEGCASIRADFKQTVSRAKILSQEVLSAKGLKKDEINAELRVLDGTAIVLKGSMEACAGR